MQNSQRRATERSHWMGVGLALGYFCLCLLMTQHAPTSWNDIARVAAIESLSTRGTWAIDDSPWLERTKDKVFLNGHFYSDKMPLLSWAAAGVYAVLRGGLDFSLEPDCAQSAARCAYYPLTLVFVGVPASLLIALAYDFARTQKFSVAVALLGTLALGLSTMILPYGMVLNHHLPAAVSLFAAFYLLTTKAPTNEKWLGGVGFATALAVMLDPLSGIPAFALAVLTMYRFRLGVFYFLLGTLPPLLLTAWLDLQIAGTIIPPYLILSGYDFPGSEFPATVGGNGTPDNVVQYAFKMFVGAQGLFAYNPILIFALIGLAVVAFTRGHALRVEAVTIGVAFLLLAIYLVTRTGNLGGMAYGERWFVQVVPLLIAFLPFAPPFTRMRQDVWRWLTAPLLTVMLVVSLISSFQGAQNPWRYVPPPAHPTRDPSTGVIGWRWEYR